LTPIPVVFFFITKKKLFVILSKKKRISFFPDPSFARTKRVLLGLFAFEVEENLLESLQKNLISTSSSNKLEMKLPFKSYKQKRKC